MNLARLLSVVVCGGVPLGALDPEFAISQYAKRHWQVEQGLPQGYVTSLAQTPDGELLVGTAGGVARFDGVRFRPLVLDPKTGVTREWINGVAVGADGAIWIGSRDAGLFRYRNGRTTHVSGAQMSYLTTDAAGSVLGLSVGALVEVTEGGLRELTGGHPNPDPSWLGLLPVTDGSLLVATSVGLRRYRDGVMTPVAGVEEPVHALGAAARGGYWMGLSNGLRHSASTANVAGVPGPVVSVTEDRDGNVWAATWGSGLYRLLRGAHEAVKCTDGVLDEFVHNVFEDRDGNLWIGSRAGLSRWSSGVVQPYGPPEGLPGQFYSTVAGDARGRVWFGSWRSGLTLFEKGQLQQVALPTPAAQTLIRASAVSRDGTLWLSDWQSLLSYRDGKWTRFSQRDGAPQGQVNEIAFDRSGALWLATTTGLYMYPDGLRRAGAVTIVEGRMDAVLCARDGEVWAGAGRGLWRVQAGIASLIDANLPVTSLSEDSQGRVWAATRGNGIVLVSGGHIRRLDQRHGLPADHIYAMVDDGAGSLWLSSPAGALQVSLAQMQAVLEGRLPRLSPVIYGSDDGMRTIECQNVGQPGAWRDASGDIWISTVRGMVRIRPSKRRTPVTPKPVIEEIVTDAGTHTVHFTAAALSAPDRLEFRYRLDGDEVWSSTSKERTLRFNGLPAGQHTIEIGARMNGGEWSDTVAAAFEQPPRMHETWWFRGGAIAAVAALLWLGYQWRMLLLRSRYRAVLAERGRIAEEWHDTLLAGLAAIGWQLDAARDRLSSRPGSAQGAIELAQTMLRHYRTEARRVIWDLSHPAIGTDDLQRQGLVDVLRGALREMARGREVQPQLEVEGEPAALPGPLIHNLLRVCQEGASNALQHARASRILVRLRFAPGEIVAQVEDDGCGFLLEHVAPGHFGISIMRDRVKRHGGELTIETAQGRGTTLRANFRYAGGRA
ncbi:MAG: hypothetical protein HY820_13180 [Acidobacteria bacterium]|nr:hypothetical protein [Acidobacteriota bacterium]